MAKFSNSLNRVWPGKEAAPWWFVPLTVVAGGAGLYLSGRSLLRGLLGAAISGKTDQEGSPQSYALRFQQSLHPPGGGTDEVLLRDTLRAIPHRAFLDRVKSVYQTGTGESLLLAIEADVSSQLWQELLMIINSKPKNQREAKQRGPSYYDTQMVERWAIRIKMACDYELAFFLPWGVDYPGIEAVFEEIPYARILCGINRYYRDNYHMSLWAELSDELSTEELQKLFDLIKDKTDAKGKSTTEIIALCQG